MVCECSRSSVESLACTCVLCCNLVKHYIFLAHMLRACMHGALPKVSGGWMLRAKKLCQADGNIFGILKAVRDLLLKYDISVERNTLTCLRGIH